MVRPFTSFTGMTDRAKRPSSQALAARRWLSTAYSSHCARENPYLVAIRSAETPLRHEVGLDRDRGIDRQAPPDAPMPMRLIDSMPPPTVMSCWPDITCAAAKLTASRPEAQKRLISTAGHAGAVAGRDRGRARDVAAGLADRINAAQHHVVDQRRIELVALAHRGPAPASPG